MRNRNFWFAAIIGCTVAGVVWWSTGSSPYLSGQTGSGLTAPTVRLENRSSSEIGKVNNSAPVAHQEISSLLTDGTLKDAEVRSGLTKISLDNNRTSEERNEAVSHLLNLTTAEDESELLMLVRDPLLSTALAQRVFEDAFNRRHAFQADICLELMKRKDADSLVIAAREHLLFLLDSEVDAASDLTTIKAAVTSAKKRWSEQAVR